MFRTLYGGDVFLRQRTSRKIRYRPYQGNRGKEGKIVFDGNDFDKTKYEEYPLDLYEKRKSKDDNQGAMVFSSDSCKTWQDIAIDEYYVDTMFTDGANKIWLCDIYDTEVNVDVISYFKKQKEARQ